jgi:hypothetical protein
MKMDTIIFVVDHTKSMQLAIGKTDEFAELRHKKILASTVDNLLFAADAVPIYCTLCTVSEGRFSVNFSKYFF